MAIFNPQEKETDVPNYSGMSKPIEQPHFSSTVGKDLTSIGTIIGEAAKGADLFLEDKAKTETRNATEAARDQYSSQLQQVNNQIRYTANYGSAPTGYDADGEALGYAAVEGGGNGPIDDLLAKAEARPTDITALPKDLSILNSARANGRISETDFAMRTNALLKDIRAKYPSGYREVIDSEASKVLGFNPANKEITSRIADINSFITTGQQERNAVLRELRTSGFPGSEVIHGKLANGELTTQEAVTWMAPYRTNKWLREQDRESLTDEKLGTEVKTSRAEKFAQEGANSIMNEGLHNTTYLANLKSVDQIREQAIAGLSGRITMASGDWENLANLTIAHKAEISKRLDAYFNERAKDGMSFSGFLGQDKIKKIKEAALQPYDEIEQLFRAEKSGLAFETMRKGKAMLQDMEYRLKTGENGGLMMMAGIYRRELGDDLTGKISLNRLLKIGIPTWSNMLEESTYKLSSTDPRLSSSGMSMNDALDNALKLKGEPEFKAVFPKYWRGLQDLVDGPGVSLTSPETPDKNKEQIAQTVFGPKNAHMLTKIAEDTYTTDSNGRRVLVPGAQSAFQGFTNPAVVDNMNKRSPQAKQYYVDWVNTTAEKDLLGQDAGTLKRLPVSQMKELYGLELKYDPATNEMQLVSQQNQNVLRRSTRDLQGIRTTLNEAQAENITNSLRRVNSVLSSLKNVGDGMKLGDNYPIQTLLSATGVGDLMPNTADVTGFDVLSIKGIPSEITNPVRAAREQELTRREEIKKRYGTKGP